VELVKESFGFWCSKVEDTLILHLLKTLTRVSILLRPHFYCYSHDGFLLNFTTLGWLLSLTAYFVKPDATKASLLLVFFYCSHAWRSGVFFLAGYLRFTIPRGWHSLAGRKTSLFIALDTTRTRYDLHNMVDTGEIQRCNLAIAIVTLFLGCSIEGGGHMVALTGWFARSRWSSWLLFGQRRTNVGVRYHGIILAKVDMINTMLREVEIAYLP